MKKEPNIISIMNEFIDILNTLDVSRRSRKNFKKLIELLQYLWLKIPMLSYPDIETLDNSLAKLVHSLEESNLNIDLIMILLGFRIHYTTSFKLQSNLYFTIKEQDLRWLNVPDSTYLVDNIVLDIMHGKQIHPNLRLWFFDAVVLLSEKIAPLSPEYENDYGTEDGMMRLAQGEMWLRIMQRQKRYKGFSNPIRRKNTFEYALLKKKSIKNSINLANPLIDALLGRLKWLTFARFKNRCSLLIGKWTQQFRVRWMLRRPFVLLFVRIAQNTIIWGIVAVLIIFIIY